MTVPHTGLQWQDIGAMAAITVAIISGAAYLVVRIFKLGKVANRLESVETDIKSVKKDVKDFRKDLTSRIDDVLKILATRGLSESHSPRKLNEAGNKVLKDSGIDSIVDDKFELIVKKVKALKPSNSYQAEQAVMRVVEELGEDPTIKDAIEEGAFNSGYIVPSVLFVGGLYIRDRVLTELKFNVDEIDSQQPKNKK